MTILNKGWSLQYTLLTWCDVKTSSKHRVTLHWPPAVLLPLSQALHVPEPSVQSTVTGLIKCSQTNIPGDTEHLSKWRPPYTTVIWYSANRDSHWFQWAWKLNFVIQIIQILKNRTVNFFQISPSFSYYHYRQFAYTLHGVFFATEVLTSRIVGFILLSLSKARKSV